MWDCDFLRQKDVSQTASAHKRGYYSAGLTQGAESVRQVVSEAKYMVLGLGDVYLGAPCAVPVDPRSATLSHFPLLALPLLE